MTRKRNSPSSLPPGISVISLRLPIELHEALKQAAKQEERTVSQEARRAITLHVEREDGEKGAAA